jgi:hypothetical protein
MHHLRDTLLSPTPEDPPTVNHLDDIARDIISARESVARGEFDELRGCAFYNRTASVSDRYRRGYSIDSVLSSIHSLWHMYYQLGVGTRLS